MRTKAEEREKKNEIAPPSGERTLAEKKRDLNALVNALNKDKKYTVITTADQVVNPYFLRRPTGIMQLDIDIGGGFPAGSASMVTGPDGAGKSVLLYKTMAMHQRIYGPHSVIGLAPVEYAPDYFYMRECGMQIAIPDPMVEEINEQRKQRGFPTFTKEERAEFKKQVGSFMIFAGQNGEDLLDAVLEATRKNLFGIIGIDSFTALEPEEIAKQDTLHDTGRRASHATLATNFFQRLYPFLIGMWGRNDTTLLCTQQVRANSKKSEAPSHIQKYLRDWAPAGGYAAKHGKIIDLLIWSGEKVYAKGKKEQGEKAPIIGKWLNWETIKGKAGTHENIRGDVEFLYKTLTNDLQDLITTGIRYKALVEVNGKLSLVQHTTGELFQGFDGIDGPDALIAKFRENPDNEFFVRREILAHAGIECAYR